MSKVITEQFRYEIKDEDHHVLTITASSNALPRIHFLFDAGTINSSASANLSVTGMRTLANKLLLAANAIENDPDYKKSL